MTSSEVTQFLEDLARLQVNGHSVLRLGPMQVDVVLRRDAGANETRRWEFPEFETLWESFVKQRRAFEEVKKVSEDRETVEREKREVESLRDELKKTTQRMSSAKQSLLSRVQSFLPHSSTAPSAPRLRPSLKATNCESALESLRHEANALKSASALTPNLQKEVDYAEDLLVRVANGEDDSRLRSHLGMLKGALAHAKAQRAISDTEKVANSIGATLRALQSESDHLSRSKDRIRRKVAERLTPDASRTPSPDRSFEGRKSNFSPNSSISGFSNSVMRDTRGTEDCGVYRTSADIWKNRIAELEACLSQYKAKFDRFAIEKEKVKSELRALAMREAALNERENALNQMESTIAIQEDRFRGVLSRTLMPSEARQYLQFKSAELTHQSQLLAQDRFKVMTEWAVLQAKEADVNSKQQHLDRKLRRVVRDQQKLSQSRHEVDTLRSEMQTFLQSLSSD